MTKKKQTKNKSRAKSPELKAMEKALIDVGLYRPKFKEITKSRAATIRKKTRENAEFLSDKFFFIPAPKKKSAKKNVLTRAKSLEMKVTRAGIFFQREGHESAKLIYDRKVKEHIILREGKTKRGESAGRNYSSTIPLTSLDGLEREKRRLEQMAKHIPLRDKKERYAFKVIENGVEGYSKRTFEDVDELFKYVSEYRKHTAGKVDFFRHVELERVSSGAQWRKDHPIKLKHRKVNSKGRNV